MSSHRSLSAANIQDWVSWARSSSRTEPSYLPKALLAVLVTDGPKMTMAVLKAMNLESSLSLLEAMRGGHE